MTQYGIAQYLYHYTNQSGMMGIIASQEIWPSLAASSRKDVRYGPGQYISDILPGTKTPSQISRIFIGQPFQGHKITTYVGIDVAGLAVVIGREPIPDIEKIADQEEFWPCEISKEEFEAAWSAAQMGFAAPTSTQ